MELDPILLARLQFAATICFHFIFPPITIGLAWLLVARGDPTGGMLPMFFFPKGDLLRGVGFSASLGVLAGIFPAWRAMRLRVADALRRM